MAENIVRSVAYIVRATFIDVSESATYTGSTLTSQVVSAIKYDDIGNPSTWNIAALFVKNGGNTWTLSITSSETNQSEAYGTIVVEADEIEPCQIEVEFSDYVDDTDEEDVAIKSAVGVFIGTGIHI